MRELNFFGKHSIIYIFLALGFIRVKTGNVCMINFVNLGSCLIGIFSAIATAKNDLEEKCISRNILNILLVIIFIYFIRLMFYEFIAQINNKTYITTELSDFYSIIALGICFANDSISEQINWVIKWLKRIYEA